MRGVAGFGIRNSGFGTWALSIGLWALGFGVSLSAHSGPPYPIVSSLAIDPYVVSVWTDPDTTDDKTPGGQFWVVIEQPSHTSLPPATRATVTVRPLDRPGPTRSVEAKPVQGDPSNQFATLVLDHEGRFGVSIALDGPRGHAVLRTQVDATYNLRPSRWLTVLYVVPFLLAGFIWIKLLWRRRASARSKLSDDGQRRARRSGGARLR